MVGGIAILHPVDRETRLAQADGQAVAKLGVVFDEQDAHGAILSGGNPPAGGGDPRQQDCGGQRPGELAHQQQRRAAHRPARAAVLEEPPVWLWDAAYSATLAFRRGQPELSISSNLQGLALSLPPPLNKAADAALPLRYENALLRESHGANTRLMDQISLDIGRVATVNYVRDLSTAQPRVLRGAIGVGLAPGESAPQPEQGVMANINLGTVDIDAWERALSGASGSSLATASSQPAPGTGTSTAGTALNSVERLFTTICPALPDAPKTVTAWAGQTAAITAGALLTALRAHLVAATAAPSA